MQKIDNEIQKEQSKLLDEQKRKEEALIILGQTSVDASEKKDEPFGQMAVRIREKEKIIASLNDSIEEILEKSRRLEQIQEENKDLTKGLQVLSDKKMKNLEALGSAAWKNFQADGDSDYELEPLFSELQDSRKRLESIEDELLRLRGKEKGGKVPELLSKGQKLILENRRKTITNFQIKLYRKVGTSLEAEEKLMRLSDPAIAAPAAELKTIEKEIQDIEEKKDILKAEQAEISVFMKEQPGGISTKHKISLLKDRTETIRQERNRIYLRLGENWFASPLPTEDKNLIQKIDEVKAIHERIEQSKKNLKELQIRRELLLMEKDKVELEAKIATLVKHIQENETSLKGLKKTLLKKEKQITEKKKTLSSN